MKKKLNKHIILKIVDLKLEKSVLTPKMTTYIEYHVNLSDLIDKKLI